MSLRRREHFGVLLCALLLAGCKDSAETRLTAPSTGEVTTQPPSTPPARIGSKEGAILGGAIEDFDARLGRPAPPDLRPGVGHYVACTDGYPRWIVIFENTGAELITLTYCSGEAVPNETIMLGESRSFMPPDAKKVRASSNESGDPVHIFQSSIAAKKRPEPEKDCDGSPAPPGRIAVALSLIHI